MRHWYPWVTAILCGLLLVGCSAPEPLTTQELHQQFQAAFDAGGAEDQVEDELEVLGAAAEEVGGFPEEYEEDYRAWRREKVAALEAAEAEAKRAALRQEYEGLIAERPRYNGLRAGLFYAGYWDFNGDGTEELLLLSLSGGPVWGGYQHPSTVTWEVYGQVDGAVCLCGKEELSVRATEYKISILRKGDRFYLSPYEYETASSLPVFLNYAFDGRTMALRQRVFQHEEWMTGYEGWTNVYYSEYISETGTERVKFTEEEYQAMVGEYTPVEELFSLKCNEGAPHFGQAKELSYTGGILPDEPKRSADEERRLALLNALDQESNLIYAGVIDLNGDGTEDLAVLREMEDSRLFVSYLWEGDQVRAVEIDEERLKFVNSSAHTLALCREKNTNQVYYYYATASLWYDDEFYVNAADPADLIYLSYPSKAIGSDSDATLKPPDVYAAELAEYETQKARFTWVEAAYYDGYPDDRIVVPEGTVEAARQMLLQS